MEKVTLPGACLRPRVPQFVAEIGGVVGVEDGRPIGMMLVGRRYEEDIIHRAAAAFERAGDWTTF